ncbi:MAG: hypothetical protein FWG00_00270 [Coriobacteriia bacterium]|jgi:cytoskeletal protein CcmA (bactofilin family)|nr:hypothetical protein [Coriobacteriia bacterium]MDR2714162.1 hypothetical protein [Coriobacteriales bacterium]
MNDKREFKQIKKAAKAERKEARKRMKARTKGDGGLGSLEMHEGSYFVEGITNIFGGEFKEMYIEGICNNKGPIKADKLDVEGIFNCDGPIDADDFYCEGTASIKGDVRSKTMNVEGVTDIKGKLETTSIICEGVLRVADEISADTVKARGAVFAREIVGDEVTIRSEVRSRLFFIWRNKFGVIDLIEATNIELHRIRAQVVNGQNIRIGHKCKIDKVDCSGTLFIDPTAQVGEIVGDFERLVN